jgi:transglutaminase-like putative cysteine protease
VTTLAPGDHEVVLRAVPGPQVTEAERALTLRPTLAFDSAAASIGSLARRLTAGVTGDRAKANRLVGWVYENLRKELATDLTSASHVLARGHGDCTEHTLLVVALARAAGLPARDVSGLMYLPDSRGFYWHAWAQVAIDGRWVAVDAAWGQPVADPGHLMLGVGDDLGYLTALGSIRIQAP